MNPSESAAREPISNAHRRLGKELKQARERANLTLRDLGDYSSGHLSNVEHGYVMPSAELLEYYSTKAACNRARLSTLHEAAMVAGARRRGSGGRRGVPIPQTVPATCRDPALIRNQYSLEHDEHTYFLDRHGVTRRVSRRLAMRARAKGVTLMHVAQLLAEGESQHVQISPREGCLVAEMARTGSRLIEAYLLFGSADPTDRKPQYISYDMQIAGALSPSCRIDHQAMERGQHLTMRVLFEPRRYPKTVWWFEGGSYLATFRDADESNILPEDPDGAYTRDFDSPIRGWFYGLSWHW